jgi:hypothetical protein
VQAINLPSTCTSQKGSDKPDIYIYADIYSLTLSLSLPPFLSLSLNHTHMHTHTHTHTHMPCMRPSHTIVGEHILKSQLKVTLHSVCIYICCLYVSISTHPYAYIYIYMYINIKREREREPVSLKVTLHGKYTRALTFGDFFLPLESLLASPSARRITMDTFFKKKKCSEKSVPRYMSYIKSIY